MTLPIHLLCHRSFFVFRLPTSTVERDASIIHENVLACYAFALFSSAQERECLSALDLIVASGKGDVLFWFLVVLIRTLHARNQNLFYSATHR